MLPQAMLLHAMLPQALLPDWKTQCNKLPPADSGHSVAPLPPAPLLSHQNELYLQRGGGANSTLP